jgi:hypothetical protein
MRGIFKIWDFYIFIMVKLGDEDFGRERIDDDGSTTRVGDYAD